MKKIVLLGAGYASLSLLTRLGNKELSKASWTLINKDDYHYKSICLHDVASGKHNEEVKFSLSKLNSKISVLKDEVVQILPNKVICKGGEVEYDYLVVGLGFESDDFGVKGVKENALAITNFSTARDIFASILARLEAFKASGDENELSFAVCGGGFTGIEFVGSLAQELKKHCAKMGIEFGKVKLYCIEAMDKILPMYSAKMQAQGLRRLGELGVSVLTGAKILQCKKGAVVVEQNGEQREIAAKTIVWTAGVKGSSVVANSPMFASVRNKVAVDTNLFANALNSNEERRENIFIAGDCSAVLNPAINRPFPPTAQLAREQGKYLAEVFRQIIRGKTQGFEPFSFTSKGSICSIGEGYAIAGLGKVEFSGWAASKLKAVIESLWDLQLRGISL